MFAVTFYSISQKYTFTLIAYKGKNKCRKIQQQTIRKCGNRRTVMYVRIYDI